MTLHDLRIKDGSKEVPFSHRDLKPSNIFCEQFHCVIGDFDLAGLLGSSSGSPGYFAPEVLDYIYTHAHKKDGDAKGFNKKHGQKADIWSMGLLIAAILGSDTDSLFAFDSITKTTEDLNKHDELQGVIRQKPFSAQTFSRLKRELAQKIEETSDMRIKGLWRLVSAILQKDPAQRPNAEEAAKRLQNIISEAAFELPLKYKG